VVRESEVWVDFEGKASLTNQRAKVEDCEDDEAGGLRQNKVAIASASNLGVHDNVAPLKQREVNGHTCSEHADEYSEQGDSVLSVEEVGHVLEDMAPGTEQPEISVGADESIFTRKTNPLKPERVAEILRLVKIGDDISPEERSAVESMICEFADVFALSVSEVKHIPGAVHRLKIPEGATFNTKIRQRPMTPPHSLLFQCTGYHAGCRCLCPHCSQGRQVCFADYLGC
jgi:hypothetical protein